MRQTLTFILHLTLARISHGEVAHIHPADGSMHMIFSPSDAKQVIEKGWCERHPLAIVERMGLLEAGGMIRMRPAH